MKPNRIVLAAPGFKWRPKPGDVVWGIGEEWEGDSRVDHVHYNKEVGVIALLLWTQTRADTDPKRVLWGIPWNQAIVDGLRESGLRIRRPVWASRLLGKS